MDDTISLIAPLQAADPAFIHKMLVRWGDIFGTYGWASTSDFASSLASMCTATTINGVPTAQWVLNRAIIKAAPDMSATAAGIDIVPLKFFGNVGVPSTTGVLMVQVRGAAADAGKAASVVVTTAAGASVKTVSTTIGGAAIQMWELADGGYCATATGAGYSDTVCFTK